MGYIRHHTIVVTAWQNTGLDAAHAEATRIFAWVSPISPAAVNGQRAFFVPPDGSKEGWAESDRGDSNRAEFVTWLKASYGHDWYLDWIEVIFGGDDYDAEVLNHDDYDEDEAIG